MIFYFAMSKKALTNTVKRKNYNILHVNDIL